MTTIAAAQDARLQAAGDEWADYMEALAALNEARRNFDAARVQLFGSGDGRCYCGADDALNVGPHHAKDCDSYCAFYPEEAS